MTSIAPISFSASAPACSPVEDCADRSDPIDRASMHDSELVRRFNAGDEEAFVEIVTRYRGKMFSLALRRLRNRADAEEIAQDTFVRAHKALTRFRGDCALSSWLHRIAVNLSCNRHWYFFRRRQQDTFSLDYVSGDGRSPSLAATFASDAPSPASEAAASELSEIIGTCMGKLGESQRKILTLRNELSHSYRHISRVLGINIGTVKSRLARARKRLRQLLVETSGEFDLATAFST
jgi:RNA polymerase sigma-70 factor (ECF subfamily)